MLMQEPVVPMCFLRVRPIGVMHMIDQGEQDDKLIAVHVDDPGVLPLPALCMPVYYTDTSTSAQG